MTEGAMTERKTPRERRSNAILLGAALLGVAIAIALALSGSATGPHRLSDNILHAAIPPVLAMILAIVVAIIVPLLSEYWARKVADEQEMSAVRDGAYFAFYVYGCGAPAWWLLSRGGLAPAPDGIIIYYATILVFSVVWLWKKYR